MAEGHLHCSTHPGARAAWRATVAGGSSARSAPRRWRPDAGWWCCSPWRWAGWLAHDGAGGRWFLVAWSVPAACLAVAIVSAQAEALGVGLQFRGRRLAWPGAVPRRSRQLRPGELPST